MRTRFPKAFRWVVWDGPGKVHPFLADVGLPGTRAWEQLQQEVFAYPTPMREERVRATAFRDQSCYEFLRLLFGSFLSVEDFLVKRREFHRLELFSHPALITCQFSTEDRLPLPRAEPQSRGWVAAILLGELPRGFWWRLFLWRIRRTYTQGCSLFPLAMIDLQDPALVVRAGPLPPDPGFFRRVRQAYLHRQGEVFQVGDWLVSTISDREEGGTTLRRARDCGHCPVSGRCGRAWPGSIDPGATMA